MIRNYQHEQNMGVNGDEAFPNRTINFSRHLEECVNLQRLFPVHEPVHAEQAEVVGPGDGLGAVDRLELLDHRSHLGLGGTGRDAQQPLKRQFGVVQSQLVTRRLEVEIVAGNRRGNATSQG